MKAVRVIVCANGREARKVAGDLIPLRAPHSSASPRGLVQELAAASGGVLYLDELQDFSAPAIEELCGTLFHLAMFSAAPPLAILLGGCWGGNGTDAECKRWYRYRTAIQKAAQSQPWCPVCEPAEVTA